MLLMWVKEGHGRVRRPVGAGACAARAASSVEVLVMSGPGGGASAQVKAEVLWASWVGLELG